MSEGVRGREEGIPTQHQHTESCCYIAGQHPVTMASTSANIAVGEAAQALHDHDHDHEGHEHHGGADIHRCIGISLVLGFTFMLLVDQLSGSSHAHSNVPIGE